MRQREEARLGAFNTVIFGEYPITQPGLETKTTHIFSWKIGIIMSDVVAVWEVPLSDRVHKIEFEHGTTTGKRVVRVDGEVVSMQFFKNHNLWFHAKILIFVGNHQTRMDVQVGWFGGVLPSRWSSQM